MTTARPVGLLLAAGRGARFDPSGRTSKLLAAAPIGPHVGQPVAVAAARNLQAADIAVTAVLRPADTLEQQRLHDVLRAIDCQVVINVRADEGIGASIACGVQATASAPGWLIALADMPAIAPATVRAVADAIFAGAPSAAPLHQGQRGHPVGFGAALAAELLALHGDEGARRVLAAHPPQLVHVDDAGCLLDLDRPSDFG
jgi:molybdenum cofactor cytidylyltransferase